MTTARKTNSLASDNASPSKATRPAVFADIAPGIGSANGERPGEHVGESRRLTNAGGTSAATALLRLESELHKLASQPELTYFMANETRSITLAQQVCVLRVAGSKSFRAKAISSVTTIDRSAPLVNWFEAIAARLRKNHSIDTAMEFDASAFSDGYEQVAAAYPLRNMLWIPLLDIRGKPIAGLLQARSTPWSEQDIVIGRHIANACAHAWLAFEQKSLRQSIFLSSWKWAIGIASVAAVAAFLPVPMTALAPVEIAPRDAFIVTAATDGVVGEVLVAPNTRVEKGQILVRLNDTVLKNKLELAERELEVVQAKLKRAQQLAIVDARGRHELGVAAAERDLKTSERDYARELLTRTVIRSTQSGFAVFGDKKDLIGRPVATGERLMEIADPAKRELRIDLAAADAIVLHQGTRVKVFLDSDPLNPIEATLVRSDYQARPRPNQTIAFRLYAQVATKEERSLRLGVRGTAQVYSDVVPLAFYLFRRPIGFARQWLGI